MIQEYQLRILPETAANEQRLKEYLIQEKGLNIRDITATRILKRSIDARQRTIFVNLTVRVYLNEMPKEGEYRETIYNNVSDKPQVVVVGAGPGDPDLISIRGRQMLEKADLILYAGSLVPKELTLCAKAGATVRSSADMNLEEQFALMKEFYDCLSFVCTRAILASMELFKSK